MRNTLYLFILSVLLAACNGEPGDKIREQVIAAVESHVKDDLEIVQRSVDDDGVVTLYNYGIVYKIDPSTIVTGDLDGDSHDDAIITLLVSRMPVIDIPEHFILIKKEEGFDVSKVLDTDMKVLRIENGIIYAEVSVISRDSPMYGCESCKEVAEFRYTDGGLVRAGGAVSR
ncbi:MAG: hypothetical protein K0B05_08540 [Bacteroidales bacterium]|nr:hypothetical protein [Bacteroidales bacterium]